ncbi:unnamed protein product [Rotaria sp. Silwood2]|nr:unnamed protein product [Rotaria sp. Silwood2]CAF4632058.1 unnamed protein product [Rotaria sp. Silwood2]
MVAAATAQISVWGAAASPLSEPSVVPKSARGSPSGNEQSCSAFPTLNESMRKLSINTTSASAKDSRSQSVHQVIRRRRLCSTVPDSAVLTPVRRPDQGDSKGQEISVYTNHFRVDINDAIISQYDIDIVMIDCFDKLRMMKGKTLDTREILPDLTLPIQIDLGKGNEMKIFQLKKLALLQQDRIENIYDFIKKKINIRPRETVRIIETLFKQRSRNELISIRDHFYYRHRQLEDLGNGRGIAKGFYQALFLTQGSLTLNINLACTYFYMPLNFVGFASKYLRKDITKDLQ